MIYEETIPFMTAAYEALNDRSGWESILRSWERSFVYRHANGRIIHPLSSEETAVRRSILVRAQLFMAWDFHRENKCYACLYGYAGHSGWENPFE